MADKMDCLKKNPLQCQLSSDLERYWTSFSDFERRVNEWM